MFSGSLSKGSDDNVRSLIEAGLIQVLLKIITNPNADKHLMEICLCVVRSIYEHPFAPKEIINTTATLSYLIGNLNAFANLFGLCTFVRAFFVCVWWKWP